MNREITDKINRICDSDNYLVGYASLAGLLRQKWDGYTFGISLARKLDSEIIDTIINGPTLQYYHLYNEINAELNNKSEEIAALLNNNHIDAVSIKATVTDDELDDEYKNTLRYSLSHKMVATRAGLGWIGKSDLLITHALGPRVRLASILTREPVSTSGIPITESLCGNCNVCITACPANAAIDTLWNINRDRDDYFNPFKCRRYAVKLSEENFKKRISICGICIAVCPVGK